MLKNGVKASIPWEQDFPQTLAQRMEFWLLRGWGRVERSAQGVLFRNGVLESSQSRWGSLFYRGGSKRAVDWLWSTTSGAPGGWERGPRPSQTETPRELALGELWAGLPLERAGPPPGTDLLSLFRCFWRWFLSISTKPNFVICVPLCSTVVLDSNRR